MESILLLIPISILLLAVAGWAFVWAVNHHQFDDLDQRALEILDEDLDQKNRRQPQ